MRKMTFCEIVLDQLPYITKREREAIRTELEDHLDDHAAMLEGKGVAPEEAMARAEEAMGDPEEIGKALAKQYPRLWLWAYRLLTLCVVVGCALFLLQGPVMRLYYHHSNLLARNDPWGTGRVYSSKGDVMLDVDFQAELPTDILRVYRMQVNRETMEATIYFVTYDRNPWGIACAGQDDGITVTNQAGESLARVNYHGTYLVFFDSWKINYSTYQMLQEWARFLAAAEWNLGVSYGLCTVPIASGDDHLTFRYDRFGVDFTFELPLPDWEGTQ